MKSNAKKLSEELVKILSKEKEISKINIFGKLAENKSDEYSDIDIRVITKDPYLTQKRLHILIKDNISPIIDKFILASDKNHFAEMIMLKDYSPYQKIDISVGREGFGIQFYPILTIFENKKAFGKNRDCKILSTKKTADYVLEDILFSAPRITKCFFRQDFDMYRRWKNQTNALLVLLNEKYSKWQKVNEKKELKANEAKLLFENLSDKDKKNLSKIFPRIGIVNIPQSYIKSLEFFITLSRIKAKKFGIKLNDDFIDYILNFTKKEVEKIQGKTNLI